VLVHTKNRSFPSERGVGLRRVSSPVSSSQADSRPATAAQLSLRVLSRLCHGPFPENDCQPGSDSGQRWASLFPDRATNSGLGKLLRLLITALVPTSSTPCLGTYLHLARDIWNHCEYRVTRTQLSLSLSHTHRKKSATTTTGARYGEQPVSGHSNKKNNLDTVVLKTPRCRLRHLPSIRLPYGSLPESRHSPTID
jgi:hypothetical protein